ncbi:Lin0512 family protein [Minwuia sp.]|uniref:Lin0512 family protein n=1 Tax=Minwuia sp. TaxID=2493630 RepID=UPI003A9189B1
MAWQRMCLEIGMGMDIRGGDSTKAASRALMDALRHNALTIGPALGQDADDMFVKVWIGAPDPESVDRQALLDLLPHGSGEVEVAAGGLSMPNDPGDNVTIMAHAAAEVFLKIGGDT